MKRGGTRVIDDNHKRGARWSLRARVKAHLECFHLINFIVIRVFRIIKVIRVARVIRIIRVFRVFRVIRVAKIIRIIRVIRIFRVTRFIRVLCGSQRLYKLIIRDGL